MLALGIDPGTRNLGWGLVRRAEGRLSHVAHGVIRADSKLALAARLCIIAEALEEVIQLHRPALGSVEQIFFHKDPQAAAKLGHARGVVLLGLGRHGIEIAEHTPARVKRTLTGNGQATKAQVAHMVRAVLKIEEPMPEDASDALAIAITALRVAPPSKRVVGASAELLAASRQVALAAGEARRSRGASPSKGSPVPAHLEVLLDQVRATRI